MSQPKVKTHEAALRITEASLVVFGFVVGSGMDGLLEGLAQLDRGSTWQRVLLYAMGLSVVVRFTLGGALHMAHVHDRAQTASTQDLAIDVLAHLTMGFILRISALYPTTCWFFGWHAALFFLALCWGVLRNDRKANNNPWVFWWHMDAINFVVAVSAITFTVLCPERELCGVIAAALFYGWWLCRDVRLIIKAALS